LRPRAIPILAQFLQVKQPPLFDKFMRRVWQITFVDVARLDFDQRLMLGVNRVKMSRRMIAIIKAEMMP
jgi:hypothetical protein